MGFREDLNQNRGASTEAISALGLSFFDGQLLTKSQIQQRKYEARDRQRAIELWKPRLAKWLAEFPEERQYDFDGTLASCPQTDLSRQMDKDRRG